MTSEQPEYNHHRAWTPLIVAGLVFITLILGDVIYREFHDSSRVPVVLDDVNSPSLEEVTNAYHQDLRAALNSHDTSRFSPEFFEALIVMRVPSEYRDMHVQLVILSDQENFSEVALREFIDRMRADYSWLN